MLKFTKFCNFKRALGKIRVFKIVAQAFEAGENFCIFLKFWGSWGLFPHKSCFLTIPWEYYYNQLMQIYLTSDQNIYGVINDLKEKLKCAGIEFIHKQVIKVMGFEDIRTEWIFF